jgi:LicD family
MGSAARRRRFVLFRTVALPLALMYIFVDGQFRLLFRVATETAEIGPHHASQTDQQIISNSSLQEKASRFRIFSVEQEVVLNGAWFHNTCDKKENAELTNHIEKIPLVGTQNIPLWIKDICPEVVEHFGMFPSFADPFISGIGPFNATYEMTISTTLNAVLGVCTMKMAQQVAADIGEDFFLYAGSHLGAILHGQPMPWDDDFDSAIRFHARNKYIKACKKSKNLAPGVTLHCDGQQYGFIKVWLQGPTSVKTSPARSKHYFPFLDVFFLGENATHVQELRGWDQQTRPRRVIYAHKKSFYYPTRSYYFGGIQVQGFARHVYKTPMCLMSAYSHRRLFVIPEFKGQNLRLDCCRLAKHLPFVYTYNDTSVIYNGRNLKSLPTPPIDTANNGEET